MNWDEFAQLSPELATLGRGTLRETRAFGDEPYGMAWDPARGTRRWTRRIE